MGVWQPPTPVGRDPRRSCALRGRHTMSGEGHPADCPDCTPCQECQTRAAWCLSEAPVDRPCPHLKPICSECWPGTCVDCRLAAERELFKGDEYDPRLDPFIDHTVKHADWREEAGGRWRYGDVWVPNEPK